MPAKKKAVKKEVKTAEPVPTPPAPSTLPEKIIKVSIENYRNYSVLGSNDKEISILLYNPK